MSEDQERREFLKVAGAALGGITMTLAAGEAAAQPTAEMKAGATMVKPMGAVATRTATFRCSREVTIEQLMEAMKVALGKGGCPRCGLLGLDILFHQGDPVEQLGMQIKGVNQATFG